MTEYTAARVRERRFAWIQPLLPLTPFFAGLVIVILIWGWEPAQPAEDPVRTEYLVTAEQLSRMSYTDSALGDLSWLVTESSLEELDQVLREYGILSVEERSQFLAQAMVETAGGKWLTELGEESYFQRYGYTTGTRGAGYLHLTFEYGQMAFATWMMKKNVPELRDIPYRNPTCNTREAISEAYYNALRLAANLGADISAYSRIVYDARSPVSTGADYIAEAFAWESAGYYWHITGIGFALDGLPGVGHTDTVSQLVGGSNWQSRREAYTAFYPVMHTDISYTIFHSSRAVRPAPRAVIGKGEIHYGLFQQTKRC